MEFLDPKKKRYYKLRLYVGYALVAVALSIASVILAYSVFGYGIDRTTGNIIQNGLIIIESHPESANISINNLPKGTTSNRFVLPAGDYKIKLSRDGYRDWQHDFNLEGSSILQLAYPVLFPKALVTKPISTYNTTPAMASQSNDRKWLVVQSPDVLGRFDVIDTAGSKHPITAVTLPADTITQVGNTHNFEAVEWASNNNHLLLKHIFDGGTEYIVLNREKPNESINLNKLFASQPFISAAFRDKKFDQFWLHSAVNGPLFTADSNTKVASLLIPSVHSFKTFKANTVLYSVSPTAGQEMASVRMWRENIDRPIRNLPVTTTNYLLDIAEFNNQIYVAAGSPMDGRVYIYKDPQADFVTRPTDMPKAFRVSIVAGAQYLSFSSISRIMAVQGQSGFAVFDAETGRQYRYDTKLPLAPNQKAVWMDGHRLALISDGKVNIFDFDGTNIQALSPSHNSFAPFFNRDYTAMITLAPSAENPQKTTVLRTELKVMPVGQ